MENANQGEQSPGRIRIDLYFIGQTFLQDFSALVMQAAAAHIDGLDLRRCRCLDRFVITVADHEVVFDDGP